jgi:hypothetical protein
MAYESRAKDLPREVLDIIADNTGARKVVQEVMKYGSTRLNRLQLKVIEQLKELGVLKSEARDNCNEEYLVKLQGAYSNGLRQPLSDLLIYANATEEQRGILNQNLGERVSINGIEGVLIPGSDGDVYHIFRFDDQAPNLGGGRTTKRMIGRATMPVNALKEGEAGLEIGNVSVPYGCLSASDPGYASLDKLLTDKGVTTIHDNMPHELI